MTVIADGILTESHKQKGLQLIIGTDFEIGDFLTDVSQGKLTLKTDKIALLIGNDQLQIDRQVNIAKKVEKLIKEIWVMRPKAELFVSSVFPKPTQETVTESLVMKTNVALSSMCRRLMKYGKNAVTYMPLHQKFLEKYKCTDARTGKVKKITRVVQPHGTHYTVGTDRLNKKGVEVTLAEIQHNVQKREGGTTSKPLNQRLGLKIQIENEMVSDESGNKAREPESVGKGREKPEKGDKARGGRTHRYSVDTRDNTESRTESPKRKRSKDESRKKEHGFNKSLCKQVNKESGSSKKENYKRNRSKVSRMVDKWEQLSQGAPVDNLDMELGEDSIVRVDLGDQPGTIAS